jgi:hypothetical protein
MKKVILFFGLMVTSVIFLSAFVGANKISQISFSEVKIGKQIWMSENLGVEKFRSRGKQKTGMVLLRQ